MNKFTPGPWEAYKAPACWLVGSPGVSVVAEVYSADTGVAAANARRIVQCVNNFDDLLAALEVVVDVFNLSLYGADTGGGKCYSKIQAAIAKATGGSHDS